MGKLVQRFDFGGFRSPPTRTPQGFLQITGNLTRTGVLTYARKDGSKVRELRHPDQVFNARSMGTLAGAPVTDLHPSEMVSPGNVRSLQRGRVDGPKQDGIFVTGTIIVQDQNLIEAVQSGERRELSPGYNTRIDATPGTFQGEAYDVQQTEITYNHLALGPRGWARSGSEVALHMDDAEADQLVLRLDQTSLGLFVRDALSLKGQTERDLAKATNTDEFTLASMLDGFFGGPVTEKDLAPIAGFLKEDSAKLFSLVPIADRGDGIKTTRRKKMEPTEIRIDGISYKVDQTAAPHINKAITDRDKTISEEKARADAAEAKITDLTKERDTEKARADAASNPDAISKMVRDRAALETKARAILGADAKLDGTDQEIKIATIKHTDAAFESEGQTVDYINARFDMIDAKADHKGDAKDAAARALAATRADGKGGNTETKTDAGEAKTKAENSASNAWKNPLNASKDAAPVAKA